MKRFTYYVLLICLFSTSPSWIPMCHSYELNRPSSKTMARKKPLAQQRQRPAVWLAAEVTDPLPSTDNDDAKSYTTTAPTKIVASNRINHSNIPGVPAFVKWWSRFPNAYCSPNIEHALFDNVRGLRYTGHLPVPANTIIAQVPAAMVLSTPYHPNDNDHDWDARLATQLWQHVEAAAAAAVRGDGSHTQLMGGYVALLTQSNDHDAMGVPPATAAHALRHWTADERQMLHTTSTHAGQKLLELEAQQQQSWHDKYERLRLSHKPTFAQFCWALETVDSRAFCGMAPPRNTAVASDSSSAATAAALLTPLLSAILGYMFWSTNAHVDYIVHLPDTVVYGFLAALAALPVVAAALGQPPEPTTAVLLPLIDSANHDNDADDATTIAFAPLRSTYELSIGPRAVHPNSRQVFISYGRNKSDYEWLLNYGFLPGVHIDASLPMSEHRQQLAEAFLARN